MRVENALRAAGDTHPGLQRAENEDRFHYDPNRGIFLVVDGVGGHAMPVRVPSSEGLGLPLRADAQEGSNMTSLQSVAPMFSRT
jgi:hypothetical protein